MLAVAVCLPTFRLKCSYEPLSLIFRILNNYSYIYSLKWWHRTYCTSISPFNFPTKKVDHMKITRRTVYHHCNYTPLPTPCTCSLPLTLRPPLNPRCQYLPSSQLQFLPYGQDESAWGNRTTPLLVNCWPCKDFPKHRTQLSLLFKMVN